MLNYWNYVSDSSRVLLEIYNIDFNKWVLTEETQNIEEKAMLPRPYSY